MLSFVNFMLVFATLTDQLTRFRGSTNTEASTLVQNLLNSLQQQNPTSSTRRTQQQDPFTTLTDLLSSSTTIPLLASFPEPLVDSLLSSLPAPILLLATSSFSDPVPEAEEEVSLNSTLDADEKLGILMSLPLDQKRQMLAKVLRSPQLHQSLGSLTMALRDGGLPMVASSLGVEVENEGYMRGSAMPLGGGDAVKAFVDGVKKSVDKEGEEGGNEDDDMDME
jgi:26S proteasome regulatory subunit N13